LVLRRRRYFRYCPWSSVFEFISPALPGGRHPTTGPRRSLPALWRGCYGSV
jgi:hypothetical protein